MIKIEMIKMEIKYLESTKAAILTTTFFPYRNQDNQIKQYYKDTKQFQDIYDKDFEFTDKNITILTLLNSREEADILIEAIRTKNLTSIIMISNHTNASVRLLCEQLIKFFDISEAVI